MERRKLFAFAAGAVAGAVLPAGTAKADSAEEGVLSDKAVAGIQAAIADYKALVAAADGKPAYGAFKQVEAFTWEGGVGGCMLRAAAQPGLLNLKFTVRGPADELEVLHKGLIACGYPALLADGTLVLVVRALPSNMPILRLMVRVVRAA